MGKKPQVSHKSLLRAGSHIWSHPKYKKIDWGKNGSFSVSQEGYDRCIKAIARVKQNLSLISHLAAKAKTGEDALAYAYIRQAQLKRVIAWEEAKAEIEQVLFRRNQANEQETESDEGADLPF